MRKQSLKNKIRNIDIEYNEEFYEIFSKGNVI